MKYFETEKVELKERINDQLAKEIEAFLNTDGGVIYIGVADDGQIVGIDQLDLTLRKISDIISDQIEPNAIECVKPEVVFEDLKVLIKINITKGFASLYCIKKYGFSANGCHIRVGTTCKSMTLEMIKERFEKGIVNYDLMIKTPSYYGDISFSKLKMLFLESGYHIEEETFEKNFKLRTLDGNYNYLAELLSDSNMISLIFAKFKGLTKATYSERTDYGNQCFVLAYEKMKGRLELENICKTITSVRPRKDIFLYDFDAVNEALINAVINTATLIFLAIVCILTIAIINNTIELVIQSRKEEIEIMRLMGVSNWYIKTPLILQGAIYGFFGALVAIVPIKIVQEYIIKIHEFFMIPIDPLAQFTVLFSVLTLGVTFSSVGSFLSIKKHLQV